MITKDLLVKLNLGPNYIIFKEEITHISCVPKSERANLISNKESVIKEKQQPNATNRTDTKKIKGFIKPETFSAYKRSTAILVIE